MKRKLGFFLCILFFSCEALLVEDISDQSVVILAPNNNVSVSEGNIDFDWQLVDDADMYQIQIATPSFTEATQIVFDSITEVNTVTKELSIGEYQWRVKAINSEYETQYSTVSFSVN